MDLYDMIRGATGASLVEENPPDSLEHLDH